tara:strand:+ start:189 stop:785 length:597 start_codon:yes stop_codon:yes gene_type:complete
MIIIRHRVNTSKELKKVSKNFGVEIDLRSNNKDIYLHHDPFKKGELFKNWIKSFKHKIIVLNVKEEGLEKKIINILSFNKKIKYFFHDQTFSTLLKNMSHTNVSIRYSEYEELKNKKKLFKKIKWIWIDHFTKFTLDKKFYKFLKKNKTKIAIVSPELVNIRHVSKIKKLIKILKSRKYNIDAVCTKKPNLWKNLISN